jgi:hypothetical protein
MEFYMAKFKCPNCEELYEVDEELAGKTVRRRSCGQKVVGPPRRPPLQEWQPWYYRFLETYARLTLILSVLAGIVVFVGAAANARDAGVVFVGLLGGVAVGVGGVFFDAIVLLLIEMGDNLRRIRSEMENGRDER